jgi:hypothetical protein
MDNQTKIKLVHKFMETYPISGICGYWIDEEEGADNTFVAIYLVFDKDQWKGTLENAVKINRQRNALKSAIENMLGFHVYVGSISKRCEDLDESNKNRSVKNYIITERSLKKLVEIIKHTKK